MYHRTPCCAITLRATLTIIINQFQVLCSLLGFIFISFCFSLVTLTYFFKPKKVVYLDLFHAEKTAHFIRLKEPFFIKYKGSQVKLYIILKLY